MDDQPAFLFVSCQRGAELALKQELAVREPGLRTAFSRPGFVTFKLPADLPGQELMNRQWVFARTHGISLGNVFGTTLENLVRTFWHHSPLVSQNAQRTFHDLHVWEPDAAVPGHAQFEPGASVLAEVVERAIRAAAPSNLEELQSTERNLRNVTQRNRNVIDVVILEPGQWWIGWHRVSTPQHQWPGGVPQVATRADAVSRAYLKMEEALWWSAFPLAEGDEWVEIGCAPGGSCQALLDRGQFVTGIDPAEVEPVVLEHERFRHLRMRGADVRRKEFRDVNWLAADLNVAPKYTLDAVEAIVTHPGTSIRGMLLTLKLPEWRLAAHLPEYLDRVRGWGYRDVRARQFAFNGREVVVVALRSRALRRLRRSRQRRRPQAARPARAHRVDQSHLLPPHPHSTSDS